MPILDATAPSSAGESAFMIRCSHRRCCGRHQAWNLDGEAADSRSRAIVQRSALPRFHFRTISAPLAALIFLLSSARAQTFPAGRIFSASDATYDFTAADLDGDGLIDFVTGSAQHSAPAGELILRGLPNGEFAAPVLIEAAVNDFVPRACDVNGDGRQDLVTVGNGTATPGVMVQLGLGDMHFGPPILSPFNAFDPLVGDLNGDGRADLLVDAFPVENHYVLLAKADGRYEFGGELSGVISYQGLPCRRLLHDVDGDGRLDFVVVVEVLNTKLRVSVSLNSGAGLFQAAIKSTVAAVSFTYLSGAAMADFDQDGKADIAVVAGQGTIDLSLYFARGDGKGNFSPAGAVIVLPDEVRDLAAEDIDGDGWPDLMTCGRSDATSGHVGVLHAWRNTGSFLFVPTSDALVGGTPYRMMLLDVDHDGALDAVLGNAKYEQPAIVDSSGTFTPYDWLHFTDLSLIHGHADGSFDSAKQCKIGSSALQVRTADFDRDGTGDLLACAGLAGGLTCAHGDGEGSFGPSLMLAGVMPATRFAIGDLDADGVPDLVLDTASALVVQRGTGGFDAQGAPLFDAPAPVAPPATDALALANLDGDGILDLVVARAAVNSVIVQLGAGDGTFLPATTYGTGGGARSLEIADVDADGHPDLIAVNVAERTLAVLLAGRGGFLPPALTTLTDFRDALATGDFNSDGLLDVTLASSIVKSLTELRGRGDGTFDVADTLLTIEPAQALLTADVTGDQRPDLLVLHSISRAVSVLACIAGEAATSDFASPELFYTPVSPRCLTTGDLDGDSLPDVVVGCLDGTAWILVNQLGGWTDLGHALPASFGTPQLTVSGPLAPGQSLSVLATGVPAQSLGMLVLGAGAGNLPFKGGTLVPVPQAAVTLQPDVALGQDWPAAAPPSMTICVQAWFATHGPLGIEISATRALLAESP